MSCGYQHSASLRCCTVDWSVVCERGIFCSYSLCFNTTHSRTKLPGKALRTLVESRGLPSDSACVIEAEPSNLDTERREPAVLFISLPIVSLFILAIMA